MFLHLSLCDGGDGQEGRKRARSPAEDAEPSGHLQSVSDWLVRFTPVGYWRSFSKPLADADAGPISICVAFPL